MSKRIVACLDMVDGQVVIGEQFQDLKVIADPLELALYYDQSGLDDLVIYDISGKAEGKEAFRELVRQIADQTSLPLTVGGGLQDLADIEAVLAAGADRLSLNSAALTDPAFLRSAIENFGSEKIVLAIDGKEVAPGRWHAFIKGGKEDTGQDVFAWAKQAEAWGVSEIILNSIDTDGVKAGFDLPLNRKMAEAVSIPVIASGGAGELAHFQEVFAKTKVAGALAASIFHRKDLEVAEVKKALGHK